MTIPNYPRGFLTEEQIARYWREGFLVVKGMFTLKEIRCWEQECRRLWDSVEVDESNPRIQWRDRVDGGKVADRIDPVLDISPEFRRLAEDPRFVRAACDVLGDKAEVFKAKLIYKRPGTEGYETHQDHARWGCVDDVPANHFVNLLVPIDPFDLLNGATMVFPGLHDRPLTPSTGDPPGLDETKLDLTQSVVLALAPGDMALFHGMMPHRSGPNNSVRNRESLFITYVRAGHGNLSERYYSERPSV
jgi:ectoine hydroxylase-related dioxygenase (phytanoyl-CoA dioxygenase family)